MCNGAIVEYIANYNSVCQMFDIFQSSENELMMVPEGLVIMMHQQMPMSTLLTTQAQMTNVKRRLLDLASAHDCFRKTDISR